MITGEGEESHLLSLKKAKSEYSQSQKPFVFQIGLFEVVNIQMSIGDNDIIKPFLLIF